MSKKSIGFKAYLGFDKPKFIDMPGYRESLLELIGKLIDFYKEM